jgi:hypothetical protein
VLRDVVPSLLHLVKLFNNPVKPVLEVLVAQEDLEDVDEDDEERGTEVPRGDLPRPSRVWIKR